MKPLPSVVCIGEALTDMCHISGEEWHSKVGGSTWNVARALSALGINSAFAGGISQDGFGKALWQASLDANLDERFIQRYAKSPLLAIVECSHPPSYFFIGDDSADLYFEPSLLPTGWKKAAKWAHFGGISLARQPLGNRLVELAKELKQSGIHISYDPNFRNVMNEDYDATLKQMCQLADVIKVSDEDCKGLMRSDNAQAAFQQLKQINPDALYFFTEGEKGGSLHLGMQSWHASAPTINVVDSVGAGDASIAGLLYSLMHHQTDHQQHLQFAIASGSAACLHAGAKAPSLLEVKQLLGK